MTTSSSSRPARRHGRPAAEGRNSSVPGKQFTAQVMHALAREVRGLIEKITETGKLIGVRFRRHRLAGVITGMPGIGPVLGAAFLAATGDNRAA